MDLPAVLDVLAKAIPALAQALEQQLSSLRQQRRDFEERRAMAEDLNRGALCSAACASASPESPEEAGVPPAKRCRLEEATALAGRPEADAARQGAPSPTNLRDCSSAAPGTEDAGDAGDVPAELEQLGAEFARVKKNRVACLTFLVRLAQDIELHWEARERRLAKLALLRNCLAALHRSIHRDLKELSWLADKMKDLDFSHKHFLVLFLPIERKFTRGLRDDEFLIQTTDATAGTEPRRFPFVVILDNLRSAFNVGSIFRSAECFGASQIHICGYTAPPTEGQTQKATMGAELAVPWEAHADVRTLLQALRAAGTTVVALETVADGPLLSGFAFPPMAGAGGCALLLGNERHGLEAPVLALCDHVVRIPSFGVKNSLNVAVAFGIAAFELVRQWTGPKGSS